MLVMSAQELINFFKLMNDVSDVKKMLNEDPYDLTALEVLGELIVQLSELVKVVPKITSIVEPLVEYNKEMWIRYRMIKGEDKNESIS